MNDPLLRQWAAIWGRAETELAEFQRRELEALTDECACAESIALLTMPLPPGLPEREGSGLVDQQCWFAKLRDR